MKNRIVLLYLGCLASFLLISWKSLSPEFRGTNTGKDSVAFHVPKGWPTPSYDFEKNPLQQDKIRLGRALFYDANLSRDGSTSCANCHLVYTGFTHVDHDLSHGIEDRIGTRNTLALINLAWQKNFMWDGKIDQLEQQPLAPLTNYFEMDNRPDSILAYLSTSAKYTTLFGNAFGEKEAVSMPNTLKALTQFMLQFNSYNSKYDKVMRQEKGFSFTENESRGYELFKANCASCHQEPLFTHEAFKSNGLAIDRTLNDGGRIKITGQREDSLQFRVPTLRNIEVTYPYMHDGRFRNLQMVLNHYSDQEKNPFNLSPEMKSVQFSSDEKRDLILFLKTLTDLDFLRNEGLAFPKVKQ